MRLVIGFLCFFLANISGCSGRPTPPRGPGPRERVLAWPKDWSTHVGKTVTLEGTAANAKLGAQLLGKGGAIWIDGLHAWPEGFYPGRGAGKRLRVTGTVIRKDDLPVFVGRPGELPKGDPGPVRRGAGEEEKTLSAERREVDRPGVTAPTKDLRQTAAVDGSLV
jgi:hypothetical protein